MALPPNSPAVDSGTHNGCPLTDQRGTKRPVDGNGDRTATCDSGAYELVPANAPPVNYLFLPLARR